MMDALEFDDVLTLPPEAPTAGLPGQPPEVLAEVLPELAPELADFLPDFLAEFAEPAGASLPVGGPVLDVVFDEDDVLSLAEELPSPRPLPTPAQFRDTSSLRWPAQLPEFANPAASPAGSPEYVGEIVHPHVGQPVGQAQPASLALAPSVRGGQLGQFEPLDLTEVAVPEERAVETEKHVVFALAGAKYAVPMEQVLEVCDFEQFTPVMNVPDWVMGVTNLRGDIVSIVDLRHFLDGFDEGAARRQPLRNLVVAQTAQGDLTTCLAVESIFGLAHAPTAEIQAVERVVGDGLTPHTRGLYAQGDELLSMLNLESLLRSLEITD